MLHHRLPEYGARPVETEEFNRRLVEKHVRTRRIMCFAVVSAYLLWLALFGWAVVRPRVSGMLLFS